MGNKSRLPTGLPTGHGEVFQVHLRSELHGAAQQLQGALGAREAQVGVLRRSYGWWWTSNLECFNWGKWTLKWSDVEIHLSLRLEGFPIEIPKMKPVLGV